MYGVLNDFQTNAFGFCGVKAARAERNAFDRCKIPSTTGVDIANEAAQPKVGMNKSVEYQYFPKYIQYQWSIHNHYDTICHRIYTKTSLLNADDIHIHSVSHYGSSVGFVFVVLFYFFSFNSPSCYQILSMK